MPTFLSALSIRWKLQIGFMLVAMITTVYNRWLAAIEMSNLVALADDMGVAIDVVTQLEQHYQAFLSGSVVDALIQFVLQFFVISAFAKFFVAPIVVLIRSLEAAESGDLTQGVQVHSQDEIGQLELHFNQMLVKLSGILSSVDKSSIHMGQSAFQIAKISHEIENISQSEEAKSHEVNEATQKLNDNSQQVKDIADEAANRSLETLNVSQKGQQALQANVDQMSRVAGDIELTSSQINELVESAESISAILSVITGIAEQTNLLALNAAIEAARAGEQGRGFAVVADEVRQLANRTRESADQVSSIVGDLTHRVAGAEASMKKLVAEINASQEQIQETLSVIDEVQQQVKHTVELNTNIGQACHRQADIFIRLQGTHTALFQTLKENGTKISNTANIGDSLFELTEGFKQQMSGLKFTATQDPDHHPKGEQHELRKAKRVKGHYLVGLACKAGKYDGLSQDLSQNGMKLVIGVALQASEDVTVTIIPPSDEFSNYRNQPEITVNATVVWQKPDLEGKFRTGLTFKELSGDTLKSLQQCMAFFESGGKH